MGLFSKIFSSGNDRQVKRLGVIADKVLALEPKFKDVTNAELRNYTDVFKQRYSKGESLDSLLPEAFAVVREASARVLNMRHFRVQVMGGIALHEGRIAEMYTGEGKTLVATLPVYLNALTGKGVHVVTVNEYLAKRDAEWMGKLYTFLGLKVGYVYSSQSLAEKQKAYLCDVTYGTNSEFGFDYLRDNMVPSKEYLVQRGLKFAIVDEVDSILIDEARTPLIISGFANNEADNYQRASAFAETLTPPCPDSENEEEREGDFEIDEEKNSITLTDSGIRKALKFYGLVSEEDEDSELPEDFELDLELYKHIRYAIKAHFLMHKDKDYIVLDGEVIIVDEFTGRLMIGRRYNEGLHQAIEAKEGLQIRSESKTFATVTFQNFFRMYEKLSGMTGTAKTEEEEFAEIYGLDVITIPTNKPVLRKDESDRLFLDNESKLNAIVKDVSDCLARSQPVLIGTLNVKRSEELSRLFKANNIPHVTLNAKLYKEEAFIVAQAGRLGAVTVATNMAGRGTDILLGGNPDYMAKSELEKMGYTDEAIAEATSFLDDIPEDAKQLREKYQKLYQEFSSITSKEAEQVKALGGLRIIGSEKHENRRIDNQLRGRAGRQGDQGSSVFYLSMEDDLMRINTKDDFKAYVASKRFDRETPISDKYVLEKISEAQKAIENRNFSSRKLVLSFDDVLNKHRELLYASRKEILLADDVHQKILEYLPQAVAEVVMDTVDFAVDYRNWDYDALNAKLEEKVLPVGTHALDPILASEMNIDKVADGIIERVIEEYEKTKTHLIESGVDFDRIEKEVLLKVIDNEWITHMENMDELRESVGLRAIGQMDPITSYRIEGRRFFDKMIEEIKRKSVLILLKLKESWEEERAKLKTYPKDVLTTDDSEE